MRKIGNPARRASWNDGALHRRAPIKPTIRHAYGAASAVHSSAFHFHHIYRALIGETIGGMRTRLLKAPQTLSEFCEVHTCKSGTA